MRALILWAPFAGYLALTAVLSHQANVPGTTHVPDYVLHAIEFSVLAALLLRAVDGGLLAAHPARSVLGAILFGSGYAAVDEVHQSFVPGRESSVRDVAVDVSATIATSFVLAWAARRRAGSASPIGEADVGRSSAPSGIRVELLTRAQCHLCEDAKRVLESVLGQSGERWEEIDVDSSPELCARYGSEIPVVLVNGVKRFKGRIDRARLERLLAEAGRLRDRREARA